jgi:hypothetical protein
MQDKVFIIGGGPSLVDLDFKQLSGYDTIAINKSVFYVQNPKYFITMDYTFIRKAGLARLRSLGCSRFFVVNLSAPTLKAVGGAIKDIKFNISYDLIYDCFDTVIMSKKQLGLGSSFRDFRCGGNSGFCGLQLAIVLGYTNINLLGFDLALGDRAKTHFHEGYPRQTPREFAARLGNYVGQFKRGLEEAKTVMPQVEIFSNTENSRLNSLIPYRPIKESL